MNVPLPNAMIPGTMMRTRANILMKVNVTCVRVARVTLQQLTATTNATGTQGSTINPSRKVKNTRITRKATY